MVSFKILFFLKKSMCKRMNHCNKSYIVHFFNHLNKFLFIIHSTIPPNALINFCLRLYFKISEICPIISSIVMLLFMLLQRLHASCRFLISLVPPRESGVMWSIVIFLNLTGLPHIAHFPLHLAYTLFF